MRTHFRSSSLFIAWIRRSTRKTLKRLNESIFQRVVTQTFRKGRNGGTAGISKTGCRSNYLQGRNARAEGIPLQWHFSLASPLLKLDPVAGAASLICRNYEPVAYIGGFIVAGMRSWNTSRPYFCVSFSAMRASLVSDSQFRLWFRGLRTCVVTAGIAPNKGCCNLIRLVDCNQQFMNVTGEDVFCENDIAHTHTPCTCC